MDIPLLKGFRRLNIDVLDRVEFESLSKNASDELESSLARKLRRLGA
jgi:hypothetical protein